MTDYKFLTRWELQAPIETVWDAVSDPGTYPKWFPYISNVAQVAPGRADGAGKAYRFTIRGRLPYSLSFTLENIRQEPPRLLESRSTGQLEGTGRWELFQAGDVTTALYYWDVSTTRRWMNATAPLLRPLFAWNHHKIMDKGGTRLAAYLGVQLVANTSSEESHPVSTNSTMGAVELDLETTASPEKVRRALIDFSEDRPRLWPGIEPSLYQVYSVGETTADVREGSKGPGMKIWAREHYDWSDPHTVRWTVQKSNFSAPGSYVAATIRPRPEGGSVVHITWDRNGSTVRGRLMCRMIRMSKGKPVAASFKRGLARLESGA